MNIWKRVGWSSECERIARTKHLALRPEPPQAVGDLLPHQRAAMSKVHRGLGAVLSVPAGGGKTLLARQVWQRHGQPDTLILCPAALVGQIDHVLARRPETVKAMSYERLANPSADTRIDFVPSLVILDEAHRVSRDSVVFRILQRLKERYNPTIVCMTGTLMKRSLRDYAHLFALALDENSPLPRDPGEIDLWADALDENVPYDRRARPDAIRRLFDTPSKDLDTLRSLLYASLSEHPQVYLPFSTETSGPGLTIRWYRPGQMFRLSGSEDPADRQRYEQLARWVDAVDGGTDPMGNTILDGFAAGRLRRTVPLGWMHLPKDLPREILIARADWEHLVKQEIAAGRALSEGRVAQIPSIRETEVYKRWSAVRARYRRSERPVLLDPGLDPAVFRLWPEPRVGTCYWTSTPEIGRWIASGSDLRYFGAGDDIPGQPIPAVFSIQAHGTGKNLQHYQDAIVLEPPTGPAQIEQLLARLDRTGQELPVTYHFYFLTEDRYRSWLTRACDDARVVFNTVGGDLPRILKAEHR